MVNEWLALGRGEEGFEFNTRLKGVCCMKLVFFFLRWMVDGWMDLLATYSCKVTDVALIHVRGLWLESRLRWVCCQQCRYRKNLKKPMWADMSQYSGIRPSADGVPYQVQRCSISMISWAHRHNYWIVWTALTTPSKGRADPDPPTTKHVIPTYVLEY